MARALPLRPRFGALPHDMTDFFTIIQHTQASLHVIKNNQRSMLRRLATVEFHLGEMQEQLGTTERRTAAQHAKELESSVHNAHVCISDLQANLRTHEFAAAGRL